MKSNQIQPPTPAPFQNLSQLGIETLQLWKLYYLLFLFAQCLCYLFCQLLDGVIHFLQCPFSMGNGSYLLRDTPLYRFCSFFKHFSKRLCTFSLFVSILSKFYANFMSKYVKRPLRNLYLLTWVWSQPPIWTMLTLFGPPITYLRISVQIRVGAHWKKLEFGKGQYTFYPVKLSHFAEKIKFVRNTKIS